MLLCIAACGPDWDALDPSLRPVGGEGGAGEGGAAGSAGAGPAPDQGDPCDDSDECQLGFCRDGVCCESACNGTCEECDLEGTVGLCRDVPKLEDDGSCDGDMTCDGDGGCKKAPGTSCNGNGQCASSDCTGGMCE